MNSIEVQQAAGDQDFPFFSSIDGRKKSERTSASQTRLLVHQQKSKARPRTARGSNADINMCQSCHKSRATSATSAGNSKPIKSKFTPKQAQQSAERLHFQHKVQQSKIEAKRKLVKKQQMTELQEKPSINEMSKMIMKQVERQAKPPFMTFVNANSGAQSMRIVDIRVAADEIMKTTVSKQTQPLRPIKKIKQIKPTESKTPTYFNKGKENRIPPNIVKIEKKTEINKLRANSFKKLAVFEKQMISRRTSKDLSQLMKDKDNVSDTTCTPRTKKKVLKKSIDTSPVTTQR